MKGCVFGLTLWVKMFEMWCAMWWVDRWLRQNCERRLAGTSWASYMRAYDACNGPRPVVQASSVVVLQWPGIGESALGERALLGLELEPPTDVRRSGGNSSQLAGKR